MKIIDEKIIENMIITPRNINDQIAKTNNDCQEDQGQDQMKKTNIKVIIKNDIT